MTRIILKPAGGLFILATIAALAMFAFRNNAAPQQQNRDATVPPPRTVASVPLPPLRTVVFAPVAAKTVSASAVTLKMDASTLPAFHVTMIGSGMNRKGTEPPVDWGTNLWDEASADETYLAGAAEATGGKKAICYRTLSGKPSVQLFYTGQAKAETNAKYRISLTYRTTGGATGSLFFLTQAPRNPSALPDTGGEWRTMSSERVATRTKLELYLQCGEVGGKTAIYINDLTIERL